MVGRGVDGSSPSEGSAKAPETGAPTPAHTSVAANANPHSLAGRFADGLRSVVPLSFLLAAELLEFRFVGGAAFLFPLERLFCPLLLEIRVGNRPRARQIGWRDLLGGCGRSSDS
jgi:hypothetical protein